MKFTPQKLLAISLIPGWLALAAFGFVAYHNPGFMKFLLVMNFLMLAITLLVLGSWLQPIVKK